MRGHLLRDRLHLHSLIMTVAALTSRLKHANLEREGVLGKVEAITNDSRVVKPGSLYAALPGAHADGHSYIQDAIDAGAAGILCAREFYDAMEKPTNAVSWIVTDNPRMALSELSDRFNGSPSREIPVIGVTGTDGKTSTVYFIHQLLSLSGERSAFLSTAAMQIGTTEEPNLLHQSTPEAPVVHASLRRMIDEGATAAVLESTSHALSDKTARLAHVAYRGAVFTNISHEHLDFHGSFEQYRSDKANLFRRLDTSRPNETFAIINAHDEHADYFASAATGRVFRYGIEIDAEYVCKEVVTSATGSSFRIHHGDSSVKARLRVPGAFNVLNTLAAIAAVHELTGIDIGELGRHVETLRSVSGRMEVIAEHPFSVIVDYAHTPASFETALPFFREHTEGRLISVFGSAGERDRGKRPQQGAIADEHCDIIVLTDEDPRGEDSISILNEIAAGMRRSVGDKLLLIPDRRTAIREAFSLARPGDTVVLLGKGHEASIIGRDGPLPWNEAEIAREELRPYQ